MSAQERGRRSVRTATAVLAGTGLGVAAAVGGITAAHSNPMAEQSNRQAVVPDGAGQAPPGQQGSTGQRGQQAPLDDQGSTGQQAPQDQQGFDPSQGMSDQQDPQGQGVSPGQGPAMGRSHGS